MALHLGLRRYRAKAADHLPPSWVAKFELRQPSLASSWGGPLNGQRGRQAIVRELCRVTQFDAVVETGTFRGTTTQFLADVSGAVVYSIEANERYYWYAVKRLRDRDVHLILGDSRVAVGDLAGRIPASKQCLFYLDAHWGPGLPLADELAAIRDNWPASTVIIDDFKVPFDEGYGYDDYGPGSVLDETLLEAAAMHGWRLGYPVLDSREETGASRGAAILIGPRSALDPASLTTVRPAGVLQA